MIISTGFSSGGENDGIALNSIRHPQKTGLLKRLKNYVVGLQFSEQAVALPNYPITTLVPTRFPWERDKYGKDPLLGEIIDGIRRTWDGENILGSEIFLIQTARNLTPCNAWRQETVEKKNLWFLIDPPRMMHYIKHKNDRRISDNSRSIPVTSGAPKHTEELGERG